LDAVVETIRSTLTQAGIQMLTWDHSPSDSARISAPAAQPLIDRFQQLYPQTSTAPDADLETAETTQDRRDDGGPEIRQLVGEMAVLMATLSPALKRRALDLAAHGKDEELIAKLMKGADVLRDSGYMYLTWARHYAGLAEGQDKVAEEADEVG
jgi:hypothetical protein